MPNYDLGNDEGGAGTGSQSFQDDDPSYDMGNNAEADNAPETTGFQDEDVQYDL